MSIERSNETFFNLNAKSTYFYKPNQLIKGPKVLNLVSNVLTFRTNKSLTKNINIQLSTNKKINSINFNVIEKLNLTNYINSNLRYQNIQSCFIAQSS